MADRFLFDPAEVAVPAVVPRGAPLHVEVGFGKDVRLLREAAARPDEDFVGVEISRKKALSFCKKVARLGLRNVRACQADVRQVLADLPPGSVASFTILFPDPWPKRRHWKKRWIDPSTAALLLRALVPGGTLATATDHPGYRDQIRACLEGAGFHLLHEGPDVPPEDRTIFTERFERLKAPVTYFRWRRGGARGGEEAVGCSEAGPTGPPS
ncbi:MAG: tRNA (guanine(46)-N(7))-methyltransferase TrmB [Planctomycetota bacterium]